LIIKDVYIGTTTAYLVKYLKRELRWR